MSTDFQSHDWINLYARVYLADVHCIRKIMCNVYSLAAYSASILVRKELYLAQRL
jgi:hypothetical protein